MSHCLSLNLSDIFFNYDPSSGTFFPPLNSEKVNSALDCAENIDREWIKALNQWHSAIASIEELLTSTIDISEEKETQGLVLSSPTPIFSNPNITSHLKTGIFQVKTIATMALMPCDNKNWSEKNWSEKKLFSSNIMELPLTIHDPLREEQFCLLFTKKFTVFLLLGKDINGLPKFDFSFEPEMIKKLWLLLKYRLLINQDNHLYDLEKLIANFDYIVPDYRLVSQFTRLFANQIAETKNSDYNYQYKKSKINTNIPHQSTSISLKKTPLPPYPEVELLQALTHEIRTPLTTIKTITKLLLKRAKLTPDLMKHLEAIDQECTEQINRMELIFKAAELETKTVTEEQVRLVPISLEQIFTQNICAWKKQAQRRNVVLDIILPQKLPQIVSDPAMLTQILTGLMEKFTRNIPSGGEIKVLISTAGNQLKLEFSPKSDYISNEVKSLGQFLLFQPDTGSLFLNLNVTKNIFQALGGKLIVRQKPQKGEVLTIFLPLGNSVNKINCQNLNLVSK